MKKALTPYEYEVMIKLLKSAKASDVSKEYGVSGTRIREMRKMILSKITRMHISISPLLLELNNFVEANPEFFRLHLEVIHLTKGITLQDVIDNRHTYNPEKYGTVIDEKSLDITQPLSQNIDWNKFEKVSKKFGKEMKKMYKKTGFIPLPGYGIYYAKPKKD